MFNCRYFLNQYIFLKFCAKHGRYIVVLCAKFQKYLSIDVEVIGSRVCARSQVSCWHVLSSRSLTCR